MPTKATWTIRRVMEWGVRFVECDLGFKSDYLGYLGFKADRCDLPFIEWLWRR
jgi:hypothetical protein